MIPRTKHLILSIVALALLVVGTSLSAATVRGLDTLSFLTPQTALLVDAISVEPEVIVVRDTTREDTRASLKERLRAYVHDVSGEPVVAQDLVTEPTDALVSPMKDEVNSALCEPAMELRTRSDWGPVNITLAEGARVIASLAIDDAGFPLHRLELSLNPRVTGTDACLPSDMVGVLIDGAIVMPGVPVPTDAEGLAGYAIDGFPIFGQFEDGMILTSDDLDECHGHVHTIVDQGVPTSMFHYHLTDDAPFSLSCFRGVPFSH